MTALGASAQFREHRIINPLLRVDKAVQIEPICAFRGQRFADSHFIVKFCKLMFGIQ